MELQVMRGIGGAGTGKTRMITEAAQKALERPEVGGDPFLIGFSSFTRAARTEAAERLSAVSGVPAGALMREGYFKTAHGMAYKAIGVEKGEVIGNSHEDEEWLCRAMDADVQYSFDEDEGGGGRFRGDPVASQALNLWNLSRALVVPLREVVDLNDADDPIPLVDAIKKIDMYESAKRVDGRIDFTDMLARFAGVRFGLDGPSSVMADGYVPDEVVGWIFDEAQDASRLLDMCCRRLVTGAACKWVWLVGDPFQVLYSWSGASSSHFMGWDVVKEKIMPKSWRCGRQILRFGEDCLRQLRSGYWDRGIAPADHSAEVVEEECYEEALERLDPRNDTMLLARTNYQATKMTRALEEMGIPYRRIKGKEGPHKRDRGLAGLWGLQHGGGIDGESWSAVLDCLPSRTLDGRKWLVHGTKKRWRDELAEKYDRVYPEDLADIGATEHLIQAVVTGSWGELATGGTAWVKAAKTWGADAVSNPKIKVGTIHSAKGMEASNVVMLSSLGRKIWTTAQERDDRWDEECRVAYVGATRAKNRLVIAHDPREKFRMELPL